MDVIGCLDLEMNEARYLRLRLQGDHKTSDEIRARRLIVKLIDAIFTLERPHSPPSFAMPLTAPELWLADALVDETSKDMLGKSLQPLARKIWALLHQIPEFSYDLVEAPEMPAAQDGDLTYRSATQRKEASDAQ